jgi:hypothetical protein
MGVILKNNLKKVTYKKNKALKKRHCKKKIAK